MSAKCLMSNLMSSHSAPAVPAVETGHVEQHAQFSVLPEESLELGHKVLVIRFRQLPADVNNENLPAVFFVELNGHFELLWFVCAFAGQSEACPTK